MYYEKINDVQNNIMKFNLSNDEYEWENNWLINNLLGIVPKEIKRYREYDEKLTLEQKAQNSIVDSINNIIENYNKRLKNTYETIEELNKSYNEYFKYVEKYYTRYEEIFDALKFNKVIFLEGPGGIGKSQYIFDICRNIKEEKNKYLCIYGKYCNDVDDRVFNEITTLVANKKFIFFIDAINEFSSELRIKLIDFINNYKGLENLRFVITYRSFSLSSEELIKVKQTVDYEEIFTGVSADDAIGKISEKYNIDLSAYEKLLYDNNPYHLKMVISAISNNQIIFKKHKAIERGTYVYEAFVKKVLSKLRWNQTKIVIKEMINKSQKEITFDNLKVILDTDTENYISEMKNKHFATTYEFNGKIYFNYLNETLVDYLISRTIFDKINNIPEKKLINYINELTTIFYSTRRQMILMLFEKYEDNIDKAIKIIRNSNLTHEFDLEIFNETNLNNKNQRYINKNLKSKLKTKEIFKISGGYENSPFNCINYLNKILIENKDIILMFHYDKYEIIRIRSKLKVWIQTVTKFNYSDNYIKEKFWFSLWVSSTPNDIVRYMARKLLFEISNKNDKYIDVLIKVYSDIDDDFIKEGILQVLCSLKKGKIRIKSFLKKVNTEDLININSIYCINSYLYGKEDYIKFNKCDIINYKDKRKNKQIYDFLRSADFSFKYDYRIFNLDTFKEKIYFNDKFLKQDKHIIYKLNRYIERYYKCIGENCPASTELKEYILNSKYKNINLKIIEPKYLYLAWQSQFRKILKKYNIKIKDLSDNHVYYEDDKNVLYKALELSISNTIGSITCNYYTDEFNINGKFIKGFQQYWHNEYDENPSLYYPISVFNEDIDNLNNKLLKRIYTPEIKDIKWVKDFKISIGNLKELLKPIEYKNEKWIIIYGSIRKKEKIINSSEIAWSDDYILNLSINEDYKLTKRSEEDRYYTIETQKLCDNIKNIRLYDFTRTISLNNSSKYSNIFKTTDFNIPPVPIIKKYDLEYDSFKSAWINRKGESIILVNNNTGSWYEEGATGTVYIKENYYNELKKLYNLKYFIFTEKFLPQTGYCDESALQIEILPDGSMNYYKHYKSKEKYNFIEKKCPNCKFYLESIANDIKNKNKYNHIIKLINSYRDGNNKS